MCYFSLYCNRLVKKTSIIFLIGISTTTSPKLIFSFCFSLIIFHIRPSFDLAGLEMVHEVGSSLYSRICKLTYLFTVEPVPSSAVELSIKIIDEFSVNEIDKGVSNITRIVMIDRKIKEINFESVISVDFFEEHLFCVFVGYVSDHQGGPSICLNLTKKVYTLSGTILYYRI